MNADAYLFRIGTPWGCFESVVGRGFSVLITDNPLERKWEMECKLQMGADRNLCIGPNKLQNRLGAYYAAVIHVF